MKKIVYLIAAVVLFCLNMSAQINVFPVNTSTKVPARDGIFYSLPHTVLKIDVEVKTTENLKGPLADLAEKYVGIENAIKFDYLAYNIIDVQVVPVSEPDPEQIYFIEIGEKTSKEARNLILNLDKAGFLCSTTDFDKSQVQPKEIEKQIVINEETKSQAAGLYEFQAFGNIKARIDTIIRKVAVDTAIIQKYIFRARSIEKTDEELASEMLGKIQDLRDAKFKLLTGFQEVAYDPETIKYMYQQLDKQEKEYLAMFYGKSVSSYHHYTFYYTPGTVPEKNGVPVFKFSKNSGLSSIKSASGENAILQFSTNEHTKLTGDFVSHQVETGQAKGIFYRIPETTNVVISLENEELFNKPIIINQFGPVKSLPADRVKVELFPETGGIKSVIID